MNQLKALIFDVDGTLAETERDGHRVAFNRAFSEAGLKWHWDEALYAKLLTVTGGKERIRYFIEHFQPSDESVTATEALITQLHEAKTRHYFELLHSDVIALRPGVERLIREAKERGLILAVATTTTAKNVEALIVSKIGEEALSWFTCISAGDVVALKKPAPDIFLHCLAQLNLPAECCLAIEDSENGLKAALGAGLCTIVTTNDYTHTENFDGAAAVFDHLGEEYLPCHTTSLVTMTPSYVDISLLKDIHEQAHS